MKYFVFSLLISNLVFSIQIIGEDTRVQIKDSSVGHHKNVGMLLSGCSGTLISKKHVLTSAHCLYNLKTKEFTQDLNFAVGLTKRDEVKTKSYRWKRAYFPKEYMSLLEKDMSYDYAVVELEDEVLTPLEEINLKEIENDSRLTITGYPGDKEDYTLWESTCSDALTNGSVLEYTCDTYPGTSGAGVVQKEEDGSYSLVAVHSGSLNYTRNGEISERKNRAARLELDNINRIKEWMSNNVDMDTQVIENEEKYTFTFLTNCEGTMKLKVLREYRLVEHDLTAIAPVEIESDVNHIFYRADLGRNYYAGNHIFEIDGKKIELGKVKINGNVHSSIDYTLRCSED